MRFQRSLAVIVGIDNYQSGVPPLSTPACDAQALADILQTQHGYETHLFLNDQAQRGTLVEVLENKLPAWLEKCDGKNASEKHRLLFYFAGHGIALNGEEGPEGYLIPQDARLGEVNTYLSMSKVHNAFHQLSCLHFIGILDCCFAGSFRWASTRDISLVDLGIIHKERFDRFIQDPAWQIITSAAHDQTALDAFSLQDQRGQSNSQTASQTASQAANQSEEHANKHSPFAAALIEALQGKADAYPPAEGDKPAGDGVITASELYMYVRDRVEVATESQSLRQTPGIHPMKKHDKGEYIFLTPGHTLNLPPAPPLDESQNPYRGLQSFDTQHSKLFFGRSQLITQLRTFVETHPLSVVLGASGSGKSSLVKAGLMPKLAKDTENPWHLLSPIRLGETPFEALNKSLTEAQLSAVELQNPTKTLTQSISAWAEANPHVQLLIFIDQTEEIITLCTNKIERQAFFQQILAAIDAHRDKLHVVLSLRSDFEPQVRDAGLNFASTVLTSTVLNDLGHKTLKARWQQGRFIVPMMSRADLREAIEKPAEARVMHFQPHTLVERLIDEVSDMPGALPLLSFALSELYLNYLARQQEAKQRSIILDRALTQSDYEALGGVIQSLTQRANQEYDALISENPAYNSVVRHVMLRMVAQGGGELARRQVPLSELEYPLKTNSLAQQVIQRFSAVRLLVTGQNINGQPYVEPAHDVLVRGWAKLQTWLAQEKDLSLQRRLTASAVEWNRQQQSKFLWNANPYLEVLNKQVLHNPNNNWLNRLETLFVQRSLNKKQANQRRLIASITGVILAISGAALVAGYQWRQAEIGQIEALIESSKANFTANRHAFDALIDALNVNVRFQRLPFSSKQKQLQENLLLTLTQSINWVREKNNLIGHQDPVMAMGFSPDGQLIATASHDKTVKLWRSDGHLIKTLEGHTSEVLSVSFSPDSQLIASGSRDGILKIWDRNGQLIREIVAHAGEGAVGGALILDLSFSSEGKIATASSDQTVKLWQVADGQLLQTFKGHEHEVRQVKFNPAGDRLITRDDNFIVKLWKTDSKTPIKTFNEPSLRIIAVDASEDGWVLVTESTEEGTVAIQRHNWNGQVAEASEETRLESAGLIDFLSLSPDGETIASVSDGNTIELWRTRDGSLIDFWTGHESLIESISFSTDGETLATTATDGSVKLWQVRRNRLTTVNNYPHDILATTFSPNGQQLAGASVFGEVIVWGTKGPSSSSLNSHDNKVNTVRYSPNGSIIASGSDDGSIVLFNITEDSQTVIPGDNNFRIMSVDFNPDGTRLVSASTDGTVKLWDLERGDLEETEFSLLQQGEERVLSVAFSPDGQVIAAAGDDTAVTLWNPQGQVLGMISGHTDDIWSVEFSPNGKTIITASQDKTAKLWQLDGTLITTLDKHTAPVLHATFSPDGNMIASASSDRTIKLWEPDGTLITTLTGHNGSVRTVDFSPDSQWLVSNSADRTVLLWNVAEMSRQALIEQGCKHLRNYLKNQADHLQELCS